MEPGEGGRGGDYWSLQAAIISTLEEHFITTGGGHSPEHAGHAEAAAVAAEAAAAAAWVKNSIAGVKIVALLESERGGEGGQSAELSHCPRSRSRRRRSEDRRNDAVLLYSTDRCACLYLQSQSPY